MKIYTRTGDRGETGLLGGHRVPKHHPAIGVCGDLDESNGAIGMALAFGPSGETCGMLEQIQQDLFVIGSHVAASAGTQRGLPNLPEHRVAEMEAWIDSVESRLEPMRAFILPGGSPKGAALHVARTVCRRTERSLAGLIPSAVNGELLSADLVYLNRLADLLFVLARLENRHAGRAETQWLPAPS